MQLRSIDATELRCTNCKALLPVEMFYMRSGKRSYHSWCKACQHRRYSKLSKSAKAREQRMATTRYHQNRSRLIAQATERRRKNPEQYNRYSSNWKRRNRKRVKLAWRLYLKRKLETDALFALKYKIRLLVLAALKRRNVKKSEHTHRILGCSYRVLAETLGPRPSRAHVIDHVCPLSQAQTEAEVLLLNNYKNFRWLTRSENAAKHDKPTAEAMAKCRELLGREWQYPPGRQTAES